MSDDPSPDDDSHTAAVTALRAKVHALRDQLDEKERRMLDVVLYCASDPVDRVKARPSPLSEEEQRLLEELDHER